MSQNLLVSITGDDLSVNIVGIATPSLIITSENISMHFRFQEGSSLEKFLNRTVKEVEMYRQEVEYDKKLNKSLDSMW